MFVCSELIEELVRATNLKCGRGVGNTVSRNKFEYLRKIHKSSIPKGDKTFNQINCCPSMEWQNCCPSMEDKL